MSNHVIIADIVHRIPAMAEDTPVNNEALLTELLRPLFPPEPMKCAHPVVADGVCIDCLAKVEKAGNPHQS